MSPTNTNLECDMCAPSTRHEAATPDVEISGQCGLRLTPEGHRREYTARRRGDHQPPPAHTAPRAGTLTAHSSPAHTVPTPAACIKGVLTVASHALSLGSTASRHGQPFSDAALARRDRVRFAAFARPRPRVQLAARRTDHSAA